MAKYEKQQHSKTVSSYGGIGSLIQTRENGSLLIQNFDDWKYFSQVIKGKKSLDSSIKIEDDRLIERLRYEGFNQLDGLFRLPENEESWKPGHSPNNVINAEFFPKWFFCPKCRQLKHIDTWNDGPNVNQRYYPKCYCGENFGKPLEQVRFVLVSESGILCDIPWDKFFEAITSKEPIEFNSADTKPTELYSLYLSGGSSESLDTIKLSNSNTANDNYKRVKSLGSLYSAKFQNDSGIEFKVQLRQSNSICYVKTVSSVFIPKAIIPSYEIAIIKNTIDTLSMVGFEATQEQIFSALKNQYPNSETTMAMLGAYLLNKNEEVVPTDKLEDKYRKEEFEFLDRENCEENDLKFKRIEFQKYGLANLFQIRKLKVTTVQTHYSRLKPEGNQIEVGPKNAKYIPAIEMYGEGILFQFNKEKLEEKLNSKVTKIENKDEDLKLKTKQFVHTFSHLIMKELEFECGYSVSSMKERLYVDNFSVLIFAVSGGNSSMGGMTALFDKLPNKDRMIIDALIDNAFTRAIDCPNDPICSTTKHEENENEAACYSCSLVPEISCELFNKLLNRNLLNDVMKKINI